MNAGAVPVHGEVMFAPVGSEDWQPMGHTAGIDLTLEDEPTHGSDGFPMSAMGSVSFTFTVEGAEQFRRHLQQLRRRIRRMPKRRRLALERQRTADAKVTRDRRRAEQAGRNPSRPPFRVAGHWVWSERPAAERVWRVIIVGRSGQPVVNAFTASPRPLPHLIRLGLGGGHYIQVIYPPGSQPQYAEYS